MKEYVKDGETGHIVPTGQVEPILDRMREVARRRR